MSTFYVLPPRPLLGERFAQFLQSLFPGLEWDTARWDHLAEGLTAGIMCHPDIFVVYREELPDGEDPAQVLTDLFGAEPGDQIVEVRPGSQRGELMTRQWRLGQSA